MLSYHIIYYFWLIWILITFICCCLQKNGTIMPHYTVKDMMLEDTCWRYCKNILDDMPGGNNIIAQIINPPTRKRFFGKDEYLFRYLCNSFIGITNLKFILNSTYRLNGTQQILSIKVYISLVWFSTKFKEVTLNLKPTRCSLIVKKYVISVNFLLQGMYFESCQQWQVFCIILGIIWHNHYLEKNCSVKQI